MGLSRRLPNQIETERSCDSCGPVTAAAASSPHLPRSYSFSHFDRSPLQNRDFLSELFTDDARASSRGSPSLRRFGFGWKDTKEFGYRDRLSSENQKTDTRWRGWRKWNRGTHAAFTQSKSNANRVWRRVAARARNRCVRASVQSRYGGDRRERKRTN